MQKRLFCAVAVVSVFLGCQNVSTVNSQKAATTNTKHTAFRVLPYSFPKVSTEDENRRFLKEVRDYQVVLWQDHSYTLGLCRFEVPAAAWEKFLHRMQTTTTQYDAFPRAIQR